MPACGMTRSKTFQAYLPSCHRTYSCIHCRAHLANHDELISKVGILPWAAPYFVCAPWWEYSFPHS
uniref:Yippee domain-containing protein n=1 Tax=Vombatus ursinus TaxID=29139 RepID=A0A4X2JUB9_VOMUR